MLTLSEFQGIVHHWNEAHSSEDDKGGVFDPSRYPEIAEHVAQRKARMEATGQKVLY